MSNTTTITAAEIAEIVSELACSLEGEWHQNSGDTEFEVEDGIVVEFRNDFDEDGWCGTVFSLRIGDEWIASGNVSDIAEWIEVEFES